MIRIADVDSLTDTEITVYPIRISQILFSAWSQFKNHKIRKTIERLPAEHVWVKWASESVDNYEDLWNYGMDILDEYDEKFGAVAKNPYKHGSVKLMEELGALPPLPAVGLTEVPKEIV